MSPPASDALYRWAVPRQGPKPWVPHAVRTVTCRATDDWASSWDSCCGVVADFPMEQTDLLDLRLLSCPEGACLECVAAIRALFITDDHRESEVG